MALSGKFLADFESFYAATRKAEVELRSMETGAGKVGASLNKMVDGFSGRKLVQDATLVTEAVERIGGASKLTEAEQAKVNRTVTEAIAKYTALGQTAPPAMLALANATRAVEQPTSRVNSYMNDLTNQVKATALGFISAQAVIGGVKAAFSTLTAFVGSSIESFAAAEASQKKLTTALQAQGMATPAITAQYDKLATTFQKTTVYSDDLVTEMQALLVQVGNVMPSEMNSALTAATNLASGLGIDLRQATMLVGKAFEGETGTLKRYGIVIDEAKLKAGGMPVVLDAIQQRFGGQAAAEVETYAGRIKQLANEWDNLKEKVGGYIAQDAVLLAAMRNLGEAGKTAESGVTGWNVAMGVMAASTPGWLVALRNIHADLTPIAEAANSAAAAVKLIKPPNIYGAGGPAKPTGGPDPAVLVAQWTKEQAKAEAATKAAAEAAKQAAKAFREMADAMSGAKAIAEATKQLELIAFNMNRGIPLAKMTRENQDAINKSMAEAMTVYRLMGTEVPPAVRAVYFATLDVGKGIPIVAGLSSEFANLGKWGNVAASELGRMVPVVSGLGAEFGRIGGTVQRDVIPPTHEWQTQLADLSRSLAQLAQISGDTFGGIVRDLATLVSATDTATKGFASFKAGKKEGFNLSGILEMSSGILGIASAALMAGKALKNMFFGGSAGRDLVKDFAGSMGGFDALREELNVLGAAESERLWVALTQGVGKNNPAQAQAAIEAITAALAKQKEQQQEAAAAAGVAGEAQVAATNKALDAITAMDDELKSLFKSIENEAPEEVMGIIEANTRAQIAGIQKERDAAQLALEQTVGDAARTAEEAAQAIEQTLGAHDFRVRIHFDYDEIETPDGVTVNKKTKHFATGGMVPHGTDTVPAMLTPGELILNAAQQANLARLLSSQEAIATTRLAALRSGVADDTTAITTESGRLFLELDTALTQANKELAAFVATLPRVNISVRAFGQAVTATTPGLGSRAGAFVRLSNGGWVPRDHPLALSDKASASWLGVRSLPTVQSDQWLGVRKASNILRGDMIGVRGSGPAGDGGNITIVVPVNLDGREIANVTVPYIPSVLSRNGVR